MDLSRTVLDKIRSQWKTLKKAFSDLNQDRSGAIKPEELRGYLMHWGLTLTDAQFRLIFKYFDADQDGKISYVDFQATVGEEIAPKEQLYFR
jgi:Ca2+-binding EF-hand superfamily protein